jgi:hypothetical protein
MSIVSRGIHPSQAINDRSIDLCAIHEGNWPIPGANVITRRFNVLEQFLVNQRKHSTLAEKNRRKKNHVLATPAGDASVHNMCFDAIHPRKMLLTSFILSTTMMIRM